MYYLQEEFKVLAEKERIVKERENLLIAAKINWNKTIDVEVQRKVQCVQEVRNPIPRSTRNSGSWQCHIFTHFPYTELYERETFFLCMPCTELMKALFHYVQEHKAEIKKMDQLIREKERENKRLKESFDTLKAANDTLKKQVSRRICSRTDSTEFLIQNKFSHIMLSWNVC